MDNSIRAAIERVKSVVERRPEFALGQDSPALARWDGGLRVVAVHDNGSEVVTDMPAELAGSGEYVTPGWLLRAGAASCAVTRIVMTAAEEGIELTTLEIAARSRADVRGLLGMTDASGQTIGAGSFDFVLEVRIGAPHASEAVLRELVERSHAWAPVSAMLREKVPIQLQVQVAPG